MQPIRSSTRTRGVDNDICRKLTAIFEHDRILGDSRLLRTSGEFHFAVDDALRRADVDVVAGTSS